MIRTLTLLLFSLGLGSQAATVFEDDFSKDPAPEWSFKGKQTEKKGADGKTVKESLSGGKLLVSPQKDLRLLGHFGNGELRLKLDNLPEHKALRVQFDLYLSGSWDGLGKYGPDRLSFGPDGQPLLNAAWNNCYSVVQGNCIQTFPDNYHGEQQKVIERARDEQRRTATKLLSNLGGIGVAETGKLGIKYKGQATDIRYAFDITFRHSDKKLKFLVNSFAGEVNDESFALGKIKIETIDTLPSLTEADEKLLWDDLFGSDPMAALNARWKLSLSPEAVSKKLAILLPRADDIDIDSLLKQMAEGNPKERREASKALFAGGRAVRQELREKLERTDAVKDPDLVSRLKDLIGAIDGQESSLVDRLDSRRLWRLADLVRTCPGPENARHARTLDSLAADALVQVLAPAEKKNDEEEQ